MEWKTDILENLLESLIDYRGKTPKKTTSGIPLITAKIIKGGYILEPSEFIANEDYESWMVRGFPQIGDVVLTTEAPMGEVAQIDNAKIALAQRVVCLRGKNNVLDSTYLKYYLMSSKGQQALSSRETGTTVTGIKQSELRKVLVEYPTYTNQKRIADILSSLDAKIENNNKINAKLEEMAQALFKSWFIDFEPFKDGNFVESELGMILEGWKVGTLGDITSNCNDKVKERTEVKVLSPVTSGELVLSEEFFTKQVYSSSIAKYKLVKRGEFAYNPARVNIGSLGRNEFDFDGCVSPVYVVFKAEECYENYIDILRTKDNFKTEVKSRAIGGVRQTLNYDDFARIECLIPDKKSLLRFNAIYEDLKLILKHNKNENKSLAQTRDTLLPKLMFGEIEL